MSALPVFSKLSVSTHDRRDDLQLVIAGKVYDVTEYVQDHPGGVDVLLDVAGKDATEAYHDSGHSHEADEILATYLIGTTDTPEQATKPSKRVKLVARNGELSTQSKQAPTISSQLLKVGASSSTLAGIAYLASSLGPAARSLLSDSSINIPSVLPSQGSGMNAFIGGFLLSSLLSTLVATKVAKELFKFAQIESGFAKYPPRRKQCPSLQPINPHLARGFLDPKRYKSLPVIRIEHLSHNVSRYTFRLPHAEDVVGLPIGQHVSVKATVDGKSVTRSYTPVSNNLDKGLLQLMIKIYPDGLLTGRYFASLAVGDTVLFRGPKGAYTHQPGQVKRIGMIAGGTGVTPMYQLIRAICEDEFDTTEVSLILANRTEEDILLRPELEAFARKYPKNFQLWLMLDHPPQGWEYGVGFVTVDVMRGKLPAPGKDHKVLVCGPPGMVSASKKALASLGFATPGPIANLSDEVFCF